jgi:hypothetical protein
MGTELNITKSELEENDETKKETVNDSNSDKHQNNNEPVSSVTKKFRPKSMFFLKNNCLSLPLILIIFILATQLFTPTNSKVSEMNINNGYFIIDPNDGTTTSKVIDLKTQNEFEKEIILDYLDLKKDILVISSVGKYLVITLCLIALICLINSKRTKKKSYTF